MGTLPLHPGAVLTCRVSIRLCTFPESSCAGMGRMRTRMGTLCTAEMCCVWMLLSSSSAMAVAVDRPLPSSVLLSRALHSARSSATPSQAPLLPPCPAIVIVTAAAPLFLQSHSEGAGQTSGPGARAGWPAACSGESLRSGLPSAPPSHGTPVGTRQLSPHRVCWGLCPGPWGPGVPPGRARH